MQFVFLKNEKLKKISMFIFTIILFLLVSFLVIYQTEIYQGKIWTYLSSSNDRFDMMRIEGLYHSLQRHQFFPIINMSFMGGFGYIVNIFYTDFLLYPAAFLRLLGLSNAQTLIAYYLIMNFLTFGVSFLCFYKISQKYLNSLVFSFIYTLSTYRMYDLLFKHDIGEIGTFLFLPIILVGIYEIFYGDRKKWLYLTFGMTAIIYSHAFDPILVAIFIVIVMIFQWSKLKKEPKRWLSFLWAFICTSLLTAAYFLPKWEQLRNNQFVLNHANNNLSSGALDLSDLTRWSLNNVIGQPNIGLILFLAAIGVLFSAKKIKNKAIKDFSIIGSIMLLCSTKVFYWSIFNNTFLSKIKYPWHLNLIITILLAVFVASDPINVLSTKWSKGLLIFATVILALSGSYRLVTGSPLQDISYSEYNNLNTYNIGSGQEYLLKGTNVSDLERTSHKPKIRSGKAQITHFKQYGTRLSFDFSNAKNTKIDVPIIGYYGFQSKQSKGNVSRVKIDKNNNNLIQVKVQGKGKVVIDYFETITQKITRRVSFLSLLIIVAIVFVNKLNLVDFNKIEGLRRN